MKRIGLKGLIALSLLALPAVALSHDQKGKVWDRIDYRHTHEHGREHRHERRDRTGNFDGFRIIIGDDGVTGIRYQHERHKRGILFIGDRHRYEVHPHPGHRHDSRHRFRDRRPDHESPRLNHFERERRQDRAPGWSGRRRGRD